MMLGFIFAFNKGKDDEKGVPYIAKKVEDDPWHLVRQRT